MITEQSSLYGRISVFMGASRGIGRTATQCSFHRGTEVMLASVREKRWERHGGEIRAIGDTAAYAGKVAAAAPPPRGGARRW